MRVLVVDRKALFCESLAAFVLTHLRGLDLFTAASVAEAAPLMGAAPIGLMLLEADQAADGQLLRAIRLIHPGWRVILIGNVSGVRSRPAEAADARLGPEANGAAVISEIRRLIGNGFDSARRVPAAAGSADHPLADPLADHPLADPPLAGHLLSDPPLADGPEAPATAGRMLTRRQQDVLHLLAQGRSTKDIARTLDLGIGTIKAHLDGLYRTLGVHNRMAAVARVQQLAPRPADPAARERAAAVREATDGNVIRLAQRPAYRAAVEASLPSVAAR